MSFWTRTPTPQAIASPWSNGDNLGIVTLAHLLDLDSDSLPVTRAAALSIPALARARDVLCGAAGRLSLVAMTSEGPLSNRPWLTTQPDPGAPLATTITWTVDQLLWHGHAWWLVLERDSASDGGRPRRLRAIPNHTVEVDHHGRHTVNGQATPAHDLIRFDAHHEGILTHGAPAIRAAMAVQRASGRAAANPVPSIDLHQTTQTPRMTRAEIRTLVSDWAQARTGKNGGIAYTSHNIEARALGQPAEQLLIAARQAADVDMARLAGVPAWAVDAPTAGSSLTYSNTESRNRELLDYGLAPYLHAIEARLSLDDLLPRGTWARFDLTELLRSDLKGRAEAYKAAQEAGLLTAEQCRQLEAGQPWE